MFLNLFQFFYDTLYNDLLSSFELFDFLKYEVINGINIAEVLATVTTLTILILFVMVFVNIFVYIYKMIRGFFR